MSELNILAIADVHYASRNTPEQKGAAFLHGLEWIRRALIEALRNARPDVIVLLGDVVAEGLSATALRDLAEIANFLRETGVPLIVAPGNHDAPSERLFSAFGDRAGLHRIKGYALYSFADRFAPDDTATRPREEIERFLAEPVNEPLVAIQHSPLYPSVDCSRYPYMPLNTAEILDSYERKGVILSISGHYHPGQPSTVRNGVRYLTCAALCEAPFSFYLIKLREREVFVERGTLQLPTDAALVDSHIHTHFGYCAVDVNPPAVMERAAMLGLSSVVCLEHAGQLYLPAEDFWNRRHIEEPTAIHQARLHGGDRVAAFRNGMLQFRTDSMRLGLEVECDRDGNLTLLDEDRDGWDLLMGAVHWLPSNLPAATPAQCASSFMAVNEQLVHQGIQALAHPFRIFYQRKLPPPKELYRPLARLLRDHNVAAEVNFHHNQPDPEFFRTCLEEGVRIILGSDGHILHEVGDLHPHLRLLREIGASPCSA